MISKLFGLVAWILGFVWLFLLAAKLIGWGNTSWKMIIILIVTTCVCSGLKHLFRPATAGEQMAADFIRRHGK